MKEQKKSTSKVIVRSALILLLLTLISGCFLGSTFARYVSKGEGDLSAGVAKWSITETPSSAEGAATVSLGDFSPNMAGYVENKTRKRSLNDVTLFTLTNEGDVDAFVYLTLAGKAVTTGSDDSIETTVTAYGYESDGSTASTTAYAFSDPPTEPYEPSKAEFAEIFTITASVTTTGGVDESKTDYYVVPKDGSITVTVDVTWTTDLEGDNSGKIEGYPESMNIVEADLRDTWIGENIAAVGWEYSWVALQGSELPDGATSSQQGDTP